jgi:predicted MFS family arabinose efflux permease
VFALASTPAHLHIAMVLIGIGCSPVLMPAYYIYGRVYSAAFFATLAGATIGIGTLGNIAGAWPLAWAAETFGWRESLWGLCALTLATGLLMLRLIQDPPRAPQDTGGQSGSLMDVLRIPAIWLILPLLFVNYAPAAGLRGLWVGPYFADVYGADAQVIGQVTLVMAIAMVAGSFAYGPLDRLLTETYAPDMVPPAASVAEMPLKIAPMAANNGPACAGAAANSPTASWAAVSSRFTQTLTQVLRRAAAWRSGVSMRVSGRDDMPASIRRQPRRKRTVH